VPRHPAIRRPLGSCPFHTHPPIPRPDFGPNFFLAWLLNPPRQHQPRRPSSTTSTSAFPPSRYCLPFGVPAVNEQKQQRLDAIVCITVASRWMLPRLEVASSQPSTPMPMLAGGLNFSSSRYGLPTTPPPKLATPLPSTASSLAESRDADFGLHINTGRAATKLHRPSSRRPPGRAKRAVATPKYAQPSPAQARALPKQNKYENTPPSPSLSHSR